LAINARLLADRDRVDQRRRIGFQVDHIQLGVRHRLPALSVLLPVHRIGHQRQTFIRRDREIGWRPEDRIHQAQIGDDLRRERVGPDVDDRDDILARRAEDEVAVVDDDFLVTTDDHEFGLARRSVDARTAGERNQTCRNADVAELVHRLFSV
jgi:hypothetical protein